MQIDAPRQEAWVGEKTVFFVKLRGRGPFSGASAFSLPQVPRCVILKVGNPVVSTEEVQGETWFVQTHEFALFSQQDGRVRVPRFEARFANRNGFTGPSQDHKEHVPAIQFEFKRPDGSDPSRFLVTTDSLAVQQQWTPSPGTVEQGAVFRRTITQRASHVTGIALAAPPTAIPEGIRLHIADPVINDNTQRGEFIGTRTDTLTYVFQQPGTYTIPAAEYVWWDPDKEQLGGTTLKAATFLVTAPPAPPEAVDHPRRGRWLVWLAAVAIVAVVVAQPWLSRTCQRLWRKINPPHRAAARHLLQACRRNDARGANAAWQRWQTEWDDALGAIPSTPELRGAATDLQRHLYGATDEVWLGHELANAFKAALAAEQASHQQAESALAALNRASAAEQHG